MIKKTKKNRNRTSGSAFRPTNHHPHVRSSRTATKTVPSVPLGRPLDVDEIENSPEINTREERRRRGQGSTSTPSKRRRTTATATSTDGVRRTIGRPQRPAGPGEIYVRRRCTKKTGTLLWLAPLFFFFFTPVRGVFLFPSFSSGGFSTTR